MNITITTKQVLLVLYILTWIIFVGVSIEAGGFISNAIFTLFINPAGAKHFWPGLDLSQLYAYDHGYFFVVTLIMSIVGVLRACLFYLIIKILHDKKLDMGQPFNRTIGQFLATISWLSLIIGLQSWWGVKYTRWLISLGIKMPDIQLLSLDGGDVWMFMGVTLLVITQIFKRGIEIQKENELTV
jgi:hypothetical protein